MGGDSRRAKRAPRVKTTRGIDTQVSWNEHEASARTSILASSASTFAGCSCCCLGPDGTLGAEVTASAVAPPPCISIEVTIPANQPPASPHETDEAASGATSDRRRSSVQQQQQYSSSISNVEDVKLNFITLLRFNKLQYFYLGALIYSVMNIGYFFHSAQRNSQLAEKSAAAATAAQLSSAVSFLPVGDPDDNSDDFLSRDTNLGHGQFAASQLGPMSGSGLSGRLCASAAAAAAAYSHSAPLEPALAKLVLATVVPLALTLALVAALTTLEFGTNGASQRKKETEKQTKTKGTRQTGVGGTSSKTKTEQPPNNQCQHTQSNQPRLASKLELIQSIGLSLTLLLLHLPTMLLNLSPLFVGHATTTTSSSIAPTTVAAAGDAVANATTFPWLHSPPGDDDGAWPKSPQSQHQTVTRTRTSGPSDMMTTTTTTTNGGCGGGGGEESLAGTLLVQHWPLVPLLALVYVQPLLLEGGPLRARLVCLLTMTPIFALALIRVCWLSGGGCVSESIAAAATGSIISSPERPRPYSVSMEQQQQQQRVHLPSMRPSLRIELALILAACLPLSLLFGLLKRRQFERTIAERIFVGANQLIEAKVSLEHQRQHQETLLLSVLPAYVAEQVKRNMLKKTTCSGAATGAGAAGPTSDQPQDAGGGSGGSHHGACATSQVTTNSIVPHHQHQQQHSASIAGGTVAILLPPASTDHHHHHQRPAPARGSLPTTGGGGGGGSCSGSHGAGQLLSAVGRTNSTSESSTGRNSFLLFGSRLPFGSSSCPRSSAGAALSAGGAQALLPNHHALSSQSSAIHAATSPSIISNPLSTIGPCQQQQQQQQARRGFNELYIRTYNNVSLLYGDIVGFTRLCTQLSSSQLVRVLNDLFSHFDHLAEKHKIMRIKILGDCYYGVSGIPEFAVMGAKSRASRHENHAVNCVNMGLDMIHYIGCLNVERASDERVASSCMASHSLSALLETASLNAGNSGNNYNQPAGTASGSTANDGDDDDPTSGKEPARPVSSGGAAPTTYSPMPPFELNMRIGIHTGHIHSGVIGLKKWQFDVWSNDVSIAMHCESSGTAGRVQVTEATIQQLNGAFTYEESRGSERDSFLASKDIRTYLIQDRARRADATTTNNAGSATADAVGRRPAQQQQGRTTTRGAATARKGGSRQSSPAAAAAASVAAAPAHKLLGAPSSACSRPEADGLRSGGGAAAADRYREAEEHAGKQTRGTPTAEDRMDEDNIRAATIGTIRQTLLAGETCNASPINSFGLGLSHHDMSPFCLSYRDPTIGKLYAQRPIENLAQELASLLLLLLVVLPLISWRLAPIGGLGGDPESLGLFLVLLVGLPALLVLASFIPGINTTQNGGGGAPGGAAGDAHDYLRPHQVIRAGGGGGSFGNGDSWEQPLSRVQKVQRLARSWRHSVFALARATTAPLTLDRRRSSLRSSAVFLVYATVIFAQLYLAVRRFCPKMPPNSGGYNEADNDDDDEELASNEHHQLTVILMLIALDSNANLLSYKTKLLVLSSIVLLISLHTMQVAGFLLPQAAASLICGGGGNNQRASSAARLPPDSGGGGGDDPRLPSTGQLIEWCTGAILFVMAFWSWAFARQLEYTNKANYLWRNRLNVDHEELEYISGINKVLLENILPSHVVQHYLTHPNEQLRNQVPSLQAYPRMSFSTMRNLNHELYHEQHDSVAVMFASIPHFYEFYDESDISKQGLGCIALLNEIICDFDKLLLKNKFSRIEKIKTIGSTYMAAAGLRPSYASGGGTARNSTASQAYGYIPSSPVCGGGGGDLAATKQQQLAACAAENGERKLVMSQQKLNLLCMVQFATSLMTALNGINKQSFQVFKLRVGVNTGPVIAGVIGAQRPFYDIWGDCVNIASRMESLGQVGRIQVEEKTAKLLMESLCTETYSIVRRGPIDVKGKGGMVTYFVDKKVASSTAGGAVDESSQRQPPQAQRTPAAHQHQEPRPQEQCHKTESGDRMSPVFSPNTSDLSGGDREAGNGMFTAAAAAADQKQPREGQQQLRHDDERQDDQEKQQRRQQQAERKADDDTTTSAGAADVRRQATSAAAAGLLLATATRSATVDKRGNSFGLTC